MFNARTSSPACRSRSAVRPNPLGTRTRPLRPTTLAAYSSVRGVFTCSKPAKPFWHLAQRLLVPVHRLLPWRPCSWQPALATRCCYPTDLDAEPVRQHSVWHSSQIRHLVPVDGRGGPRRPAATGWDSSCTTGRRHRVGRHAKLVRKLGVGDLAFWLQWSTSDDGDVGVLNSRKTWPQSRPI